MSVNMEKKFILLFYQKKQVLRNFKFYQTFKPRPSQNSNTFFCSKSLKYLKIYFNQFFKKKIFLRSRKKIIS
jgi:hypothetical protein